MAPSRPRVGKPEKFEIATDRGPGSPKVPFSEISSLEPARRCTLLPPVWIVDNTSTENVCLRDKNFNPPTARRGGVS